MGRTFLPERDLALAWANDKKAWDRFVENFAGLIYSAAYRVIRMKTGRSCEDDARDAAQEVFLRLVKDDFRLFKTYNPEKASLSTWLTVATRSTAIDFLRRRARDERFDPLDEEMPDPKIAADPLERPLDGLPEGLLSERQSRALRLLFEEDMDVEEAAAAMDVQAQTVRSLKHQALVRLRGHYGA